MLSSIRLDIQDHLQVPEMFKFSTVPMVNAPHTSVAMQAFL